MTTGTVISIRWLRRFFDNRFVSVSFLSCIKPHFCTLGPAGRWLGWPNVPLIQPRLNSVEEWRFINHNNDEHPIHVHVNDFQVIEYFDPTTGLRTGPDKFSIDNANAPAPTMHSDESVIQPGILAIRTRFDE